jgi:hypothetical protein
MKRKELIRQRAEAGCVFVRHGAKHDIYENPKIGKNNLFHDIQKLMINLQNT